MKTSLFVVILFFMSVALAETTPFHLPRFACHAEAEEKVDTTPQSPPLVVDDPGTPGCNRWELNFVFDVDYTVTDREYELPLFDFNYGVGDDIQIKYEVPYVAINSDGQNRSGISTSNLGLKVKFYEEESSETQIAVYPQYLFLTPQAKGEENGVAEKGMILTLPILFTRKLGANSMGDIMMTANLGYNISTKPDVTDYFSGAFGLGIAIFPKVALVGEIAGTKSLITSRFDTRDELYRADLGVMMQLSKVVLLFGSVGESLYSWDHQDHTFALFGTRLNL